MITARTPPDAAGHAWKLVEGWWCPCVGPDASDGHHASECPARVRIQEWVATCPGWRVPTWHKAGNGDQDETRVPLVRCRMLNDADPLPPAASRLLASTGDRPTRLTYARGWGRRLVPGAGDDGKGKFLPWPVESVALRVSGVCAVAWNRREGEETWQVDAAYAVWEGRIWPVNVTAIGKLLRSMGGGA